MTSDLPSLDRRAFLLGATAGLGALLLPRGARATTASGLKVMVIGGSAMVGALGKYIEDGLTAQGYETMRKAKSSTGLARPDFFDWIEEAARLRESFQPDATVCMFGGNDGQGLHMGKGADPQWIRWHEEGWAEEYGRRVAAFADAVAPDGEQVFWMGMPVMRSSKLSSRMERMNAIFEAQMSVRVGGHFIDTWAVLADGNGNYSDHIRVDGKNVKVRTGDGVHYTMRGAQVLADHVVPTVHEQLSA